MMIVEIIGNLGADAVVKEFGGQKFISFSVAHTEKYTDGQGVKHERTTWVSCLRYGESAVLNYLKKGTRVFLRGDLSAKIYEAGNGPQVGISCRVRELELLGGGSRAEQTEQEPGYKAEAGNYIPATTNQPTDQIDDLPF